MMTSSFMSGCYARTKAQLKYLSLIFFMIINTTSYAQDSALRNESEVIALDEELLEFLSFYELDDADLLDVAIDEVGKSEMSNTNSKNSNNVIKGEINE